MESSVIYAISAGGIFSLFVLLQFLRCLAPLKSCIRILLLKHLIYPYILARHRLAGPWTRAGLVAYIFYAGANGLCLSFPTPSLSELGQRAAQLSLVNMTFLYTGPHLSFAAQILGVSLRTIRRFHSWSACTGTALLIAHIVIAVLVDQATFPLTNYENLLTATGSVFAGTIIVASLPCIRRRAYEIFLRAHQGMAAFLLYATWRHLPTNNVLAKLCIYVSVGIFTITVSLQVLLFGYQNGAFTSDEFPRAYVSSDDIDDSQRTAQSEEAIQMRIVLPRRRPMKMDAGQYVIVWMPTVSLTSWTQFHPFMVTSWSQGEQTALDLYVKSYRGLSATLNRRARAVEKGSVSFTTFVSGPYGISERVDKYETVLLIAGGSGIAAVIPYLKKLIYGYNTSTCHTRRVHLVWQLQTLDLAMAAEASINSLLEDDTLSDGYILTISIYVEAGKLAKLGRHERAFVVKGSVNYSRIILEEASGQHIERRSNAEESRGEVLVMVSTSNETRDEIRSVVRDLLDDNVTMAELEYQPE